jgi:hypothetical protein
MYFPLVSTYLWKLKYSSSNQGKYELHRLCLRPLARVADTSSLVSTYSQIFQKRLLRKPLKTQEGKVAHSSKALRIARKFLNTYLLFHQARIFFESFLFLLLLQYFHLFNETDFFRRSIFVCQLGSYWR